MNLVPTKVIPKPNKVLFIEYSNGVSGDVDLNFLLNNFIYEELKNDQIFANVFIDETSKDICWQNNVSICKDMLYNQLKLVNLTKSLKLDLTKI